ncbi:PrsW family intramembrane metalloprotease [Halococcus salsus]|uniref:PrsW family intramembrane metalloprotease n=1 Tax=Halococcus salsus TaxID=2162894 RepID=UPI0018657D9E|nr:PrsW family intramembrane metalloprotease [Halococcus salsus]
MASRRDPVQSSVDGSRDLYDIATWDVRSPLDRVAVFVYRFLSATARFILVAVALLLLYQFIQFSSLSRVFNPVITGFTLLSVVPALALVVFVWRSDITSEPVSLLAATFALGVLFAGFAAVVNDVGSRILTVVPIVGPIWFYYLVVGPIEETVKWLAVRLYAFRSVRFDAVIDGAVYGAVAGLGFATIENALYITNAVGMPVASNLLGAGGGITPVRAIAGPGHVIYAAFSGYYLGLAKFNPDRAGPIVVKGLLIAVFIHGTYNTLSFVPGIVAGLLDVPYFLALLGFVVVYDGFFGYFLFRKLARYRAAYRTAGNDGGRVPAGVERTEFED